MKYSRKFQPMRKKLLHWPTLPMIKLSPWKSPNAVEREVRKNQMIGITPEMLFRFADKKNIGKIEKENFKEILTSIGVSTYLVI